MDNDIRMSLLSVPVKAGAVFDVHLRGVTIHGLTGREQPAKRRFASACQI